MVRVLSILRQDCDDHLRTNYELLDRIKKILALI